MNKTAQTPAWPLLTISIGKKISTEVMRHNSTRGVMGDYELHKFYLKPIELNYK